MQSRVKESIPLKNFCAKVLIGMPDPTKYRQDETPRLNATGTPTARHTTKLMNSTGIISADLLFCGNFFQDLLLFCLFEVPFLIEVPDHLDQAEHKADGEECEQKDL